MALADELRYIYFDTVHLWEAIHAILLCCDPAAAAAGRSCWTAAPRADRAGNALALGCRFQLKKLQQDIGILRRDLYRQMKWLEPRGDPAGVARELFFLDTLVGYLDWTSRPIESEVAQLQQLCSHAAIHQILESSVALEWHIDKLNSIVWASQLETGTPQPEALPAR